MGSEVFAIHQLPILGAVTIGRADSAEVRLDDPLASRMHARLHIGMNLEVEDLGSANKTRVRDVALAPGERVAITPGEAISIGATILMVQQRLPPRVRVMRPHGYMEARLEEECARSETTRDAFALVRLHVDAPATAARVAELLAPVLRLPDMLALYGPYEYEVLLASTSPDLASTITAQLIAVLTEAGFEHRTSIATYPRDGRTPEALAAVASQRLRGVQDDRTAGHALVQDPVMERVQAMADRAAAGTINVLIVGETGVGKEVLAERVHKRSPRASRPFLCLNCASLSEHLLESELFGHERGAFTGASDAKPGLLETAPGGTVFLDEVGELPFPLQAKLLRVLETRLVTRVGGLKARSIDVRFVAATNRNLEEEVAAGRFRRDLYFRLNGMTLHIPPLRSRRAEIAPLARIFLQQFAEPLERPTPRLSREAQRILEGFIWPGNIRELRNMMERAVLLSTGEEILPEHLPLDTMATTLPPPAQSTRSTQEMTPLAPGIGVEDGGGDFEDEREKILRVLAECGGNQTRAARLLNMARSTLVLRLNSYQVARPRK
jgi:DNA-binding NtrC family response regulator